MELLSCLLFIKQTLVEALLCFRFFLAPPVMVLKDVEASPRGEVRRQGEEDILDFFFFCSLEY